LCLALCAIVLGDTLKLKDGTKLEGKVIPKGDNYWIKLADGSTRTVAKSQVLAYEKYATGAPVAPAPAATPIASATNKPASPATPAAPAAPMTFALTKSKADKVDSPVLGVSIWEKFIESNPSADDLAAAKKELEIWKKLEADKAEKINGKWIGGQEKKDLQKKVRELVTQGYKALDGSQSIEGMKKLEEALKLYPNSFEANFGLGYFYLVKGAVGPNGRGNIAYQEKAVKALEAAAKINPGSSSTWSNLAIGYNFRSRYVESVEAAYKAVKIEDSKETVQNLVNSIAYAPDGLQQNNQKVKPIMEDAFILAGKHGISRQGGTWTYIPPKEPGEEKIKPTEVAGEGKPGPAWSGSGFFITEDGYLITNHHVATGEPHSPVLKNITFRIRMDDGTSKNAQLIAVDDKADIALMKIKTSSPVPFLKLAEDNPRQAAKALVLGYPATFEEEMSLQISEGQVKSLHPGDEHEVWFDLNTTHGNSGGPIVDRSCRVIGILTGGATVYNVTYVLGVGPNQMMSFFKALGDKAPKFQTTAVGTEEFNGEALTERAKKATVLITAIRGEKSTDEVMNVTASGTSTTKPTEKAEEGEKPKEDGDGK